MSFLESAHQSYLKTAIAMPTSGHSKNFVDQCYAPCKVSIQTEEHVLLFCHETKQVRDKYKISSGNIKELFELEDHLVVNFVYEAITKMDL